MSRHPLERFVGDVVSLKAGGSDRLARVVRGYAGLYALDAHGELVTGRVTSVCPATPGEVASFEAVEVACQRADIAERRGAIGLVHHLRRTLGLDRDAVGRALEDVERELIRRGKAGRESQVRCARVGGGA